MYINNFIHYVRGTHMIYLCITDPERFRFASETSFGKRHLSFWTKNPVLIWIVSQSQTHF
jgi:hypothetical protein